jgi:hypothetical protein
MSWTIACFCGNVYAAPAARCDLCNRTLSRAVTHEPSAIASVPCGFQEIAGGTSHTPSEQGHGSSPRPTDAQPGRKRADA